MWWKLGLALAGMMVVMSGGFYLAGQYFSQEQFTALPEQDEPATPFASEHEEPSAEELPVPPVEKDDKVVVPAVHPTDAAEKKAEIPIAYSGTKEQSVEPPQAETAETTAPEPKPAPEPPQARIVQPIAPLTKPVGTPQVPTPALPPPSPPLNLDVTAPPSPPLPPPPGGPVAPPISSPPVRDVVHCAWNIQMEVVKGRTIVTAKAGKDACFKIECDQLDLQAPKGSLRASGKVKISGPGLEGTSSVLTLNLQEDRVLLEGEVKVKSSRDKQDLELTGDRLSLRLINNTDEARKVIPQIRGIPMLGPVPIALDFGFPIVKGPNDRAQLFSFWVGLFR